MYKKGIHADNEDRKFFNFVWKENLFQTQMKNISNTLVSYRRTDNEYISKLLRSNVKLSFWLLRGDTLSKTSES